MRQLAFFSILFFCLSTYAFSQEGWLTNKNGCKYYTYGNANIRSFAWTGSCKNKIIDGNGTLTMYQNGSIHYTFTGLIQNGVMKSGVKKSDAEVYTGEFLNGRYDGQGELIYPSGEKYKGQFANGMPNGYGTYTFNSGNRYEGYLKDGIRNGKGIFYYANGDRLESNFWSDGQVTGYGVKYFANGNKHSGNYIRNLRNGEGKFQWVDGSYYTGTYSGNEFETGKIYDKNGALIREFENGQEITSADKAMRALNFLFGGGSNNSDSFKGECNCSSCAGYGQTTINQGGESYRGACTKCGGSGRQNCN